MSSGFNQVVVRKYLQEQKIMW